MYARISDSSALSAITWAAEWKDAGAVRMWLGNHAVRTAVKQLACD
jgi:hypothetical protein